MTISAKRNKFEIDGVVNTIIENIPTELFGSSTTKFLDPACGGGQFLAGVIAKLHEAGHSAENIKSRVFGFETNRFAIRDAKFKLQNAATIKKKDFINEEVEMKFDVVVGNPPYKNGLFRKFMEKGLRCLAQNGIMIQVSPDERGLINRKNDITKKLMRDGGLQDVFDCDNYFNVGTVTPIVTYIFHKGKTANPEAIEPSMTEDEKLTKSIIDKISAKKEEVGSLIAKTMGTPPRKGDKSEVDILKAISATGPTYDVAPADTVRYFDNADGVYFLNPFFNVNSSTVVKGTGSLYIHKDNIHTVTSDVDYTEEDFARLFTTDAIKFMMSFYRGSYWRNKGWIINEVPQIPTDVTDVNTYFGLTADEIAYIEKNI